MRKPLGKDRDLRSVVAVERALEVLDAVCSSSSMGVKQISEMVGLSISTVHRLLAALLKKGLVTQDPVTKKYAMGSHLLDYSLTYLRRMDLPVIASPHMRRLRDATRETVTLSARDGWSRVYLAQIESPQEIRQTVELGGRFALHMGASGKAILAFLPKEEQEKYLSQPGLRVGNRPLDVTQILQDLADVQRRGYAISAGERLPGAASVAAPIRDYRGDVIGCISISGPAWRFTADLVTEFGGAVVATAATISIDLGAIQ